MPTHRLNSLHRATALAGWLCATALTGGSNLAMAAVFDAGSSKASTQVSCTPGSERRINNWVRSCVLDRQQTFNRIQVRNPGAPPTTVPVRCAANRPASFDELGYLENCTVAPARGANN